MVDVPPHLLASAGRVTRRQPWRAVMVGQAPSRDGEGYSALTGRPMGVLLRAADISAFHYACLFDRVNLVPWYPGSSGDGDAFPAAVAAERWYEDLVPMVHGRRVIAWGRATASVLGVPAGAPPLTWVDRDVLGVEYTVCLLPHPSGRNRWWNDPRNRVAAGNLLREECDRALKAGIPHRPALSRLLPRSLCVDRVVPRKWLSGALLGPLGGDR